MLALRVPFAASSGVLVTLAVFSVLWRLVSAPIDIVAVAPTVKVDWTRKIASTPIETKRPQKVRREPPPISVNPPRITGGTGGDPPTEFTRVKLVGPPIERGRGLPIGVDGDAIPIVRPTPEYPSRAQASGTEGWVQVRFTVTTIGSVKDAIVVDADPKNVFDDAALKAIARWRYNPRVEGGVAVERVGLQAVIRFQLER